MKKLSKVLVLVLSVVMVLAMSASVFAADVTVENATKGQTYTAYKIFNAVYSEDGKNVTYTVPASLESKVTDPFSVGTVTAKNGEHIVALAEDTPEADVIAWANDNYKNFDSTGITLTYDVTTGTAKATGLGAGYYFITSSLGSVFTIESVNDKVTVVDKNESTPDGPVKVITAENGTTLGSASDSNEAAVGSTESFEVTFNATNWVQDADHQTPGSATPSDNTKVTVWNFKDTPTGLDIDKDSVKVFVNGADVTSTIPAANIAVSSDGVLTIDIPWVNSTGGSLYDAETAGSALIPVKVTYDATVKADAASAAAPNTVDVKYNTNNDLGTDTATTYTYKFQLDKVKEDLSPLPGAKFQLIDASGSVIKLVATADGYRKALSDNETGAVDTIDMTTNASRVISGLDKDAYTLVETQVPDGYTQAADTTVSAESLTRVDHDLPQTAAARVINKQGTVLPSTGGIGTTIFYIVGAALVIGCGIVLISRKRMQKK